MIFAFSLLTIIGLLWQVGAFTPSVSATKALTPTTNEIAVSDKITEDQDLKAAKSKFLADTIESSSKGTLLQVINRLEGSQSFTLDVTFLEGAGEVKFRDTAGNPTISCLALGSDFRPYPKDTIADVTVRAGETISFNEKWIHPFHVIEPSGTVAEYDYLPSAI